MSRTRTSGGVGATALSSRGRQDAASPIWVGAPFPASVNTSVKTVGSNFAITVNATQERREKTREITGEKTSVKGGVVKKAKNFFTTQKGEITTHKTTQETRVKARVEMSVIGSDRKASQ